MDLLSSRYPLLLILPCRWTLNMAWKLLMALFRKSDFMFVAGPLPRERLWGDDVQEINCGECPWNSTYREWGVWFWTQGEVALCCSKGLKLVMGVLELRGSEEWSLTEASAVSIPRPAWALGSGCDPGQPASSQAGGSSHVGIQSRTRNWHQS